MASAGFAAARALFRPARDFGLALDAEDLDVVFEAGCFFVAAFVAAMSLSCLALAETRGRDKGTLQTGRIPTTWTSRKVGALVLWPRGKRSPDAFGLLGKVVPDRRRGECRLTHGSADLVEPQDDIACGVEARNARAGMVIHK